MGPVFVGEGEDAEHVVHGLEGATPGEISPVALIVAPFVLEAVQPGVLVFILLVHPRGSVLQLSVFVPINLSRLTIRGPRRIPPFEDRRGQIPPRMLQGPCRRHLEELKVLSLREFPIRGRGRRPQNHPSAAVTLDIDGDVRMTGDEVDLGPGDLFLHGIQLPAPLDRVGLPVPRIVPVGEEPGAEPVLVDLVVTVVVQALRIERVEGALHLIGSLTDHDPRIGFGDLPLSFGIDLSHLDDMIVSVHILRRVFVEGKISIIVRRIRVFTRRLPGQVGLSTIDVEAWHDIPHVVVDEIGDLLVLPIVLQQVPDGVEVRGRGDDLPGVNLIDEDAGFVFGLPRLWVVDGQHPHLPAHLGLDHGFQPG